MIKPVVKVLAAILSVMTIAGYEKNQISYRVVREELIAKINYLALIPECIQVSPDNQRLAYAQGIGRRTFVEDNLRQGKVYPAIGAGSLIFSPDSKRLAYSAAVEGGKWRMIVDGVEGDIYQGVGPVVFSPDSRKVAYMAIRNGRQFVVGDVKGGDKGYDGIGEGTPCFSQDGMRMVFSAGLNGKMFIVIGGKEGKKYDNVGDVMFSPDGKRLAYLAAYGTVNDHRQFAVVDGHEEKIYEGIGSPLFSPDSRHFAYVATEGTEQFLVVDGVEQKRYFGVRNPIYSPDSQRLAYIATPTRIGRQFIVVDDKPQGLVAPSEGGKEDWKALRIADDSLAFSPDGKRLAYFCGKINEWFLVVDGKALGKKYDGMWNPVFSSDSRHIAYTVRVGNIGIPVVDGVEETRYKMLNAPGSRIIFDSPDTFRFLAEKTNQICLVREEIKNPQ